MRKITYGLMVAVHHYVSKSGRFFPLFLFFIVLSAGLYGCSSESGGVSSGGGSQAAVIRPGDSSDVFLSHAAGFSVQNHDGFRTLTITIGLEGRNDTLRYLLLPADTPVPEGFHNYLTIRTPVERVALFSTTHIGYVDLLGCADRIVAVARPEYVNNPFLQTRIRNGDIAEIGMPFSPNMEVILELDPDVLVATALPASRKTDYQALKSAGIPVLVVAEWLESSPLGRTEWLKLYAALFDREELAAEKFAGIETSYNTLAALTDSVSHRPLVIPGMPFKDAWFVPGGNSYVAALLRDAGAGYHWNDRAKTGSIKMDIEAVYPVALDAEYWLNPGTVLTLDELLAKDIRFSDFASVRAGNVYNNNKQLNPAGGNAYWERGAVQPHRILEDLIRILHPGVLPEGKNEDSLTFYRHIQ